MRERAPRYGSAATAFQPRPGLAQSTASTGACRTSSAVQPGVERRVHRSRCVGRARRGCVEARVGERQPLVEGAVVLGPVPARADAVQAVCRPRAAGRRRATGPAASCSCRASRALAPPASRPTTPPRRRARAAGGRDASAAPGSAARTAAGRRGRCRSAARRRGGARTGSRRSSRRAAHAERQVAHRGRLPGQRQQSTTRRNVPTVPATRQPVHQRPGGSRMNSAASSRAAATRPLFSRVVTSDFFERDDQQQPA